VLDDRERKTLLEIERRLLIEDPVFCRSFRALRSIGAVRPIAAVRQPALPERARRAGRVAGVALTVLILMGPLPLTQAEIACKQGASRPRVARPAMPGSEREGRT
jgi:hypothetical protein